MVLPSRLKSHNHSKITPISIMTGSKIIAGSLSDFVAVGNILLPICCHIDSGMPYLRIFVEDIVALHHENKSV